MVYFVPPVLLQEAVRRLFQMWRPDALAMCQNPLLNLILLKIITSNCTLIGTFPAPVLQQRYSLPLTPDDTID